MYTMRNLVVLDSRMLDRIRDVLLFVHLQVSYSRGTVHACL